VRPAELQAFGASAAPGRIGTVGRKQSIALAAALRARGCDVAVTYSARHGFTINTSTSSAKEAT
jgi:hypothetical protein